MTGVQISLQDSVSRFESCLADNSRAFEREPAPSIRVDMFLPPHGALCALCPEGNGSILAQDSCIDNRLNPSL